MLEQTLRARLADALGMDFDGTTEEELISVVTLGKRAHEMLMQVADALPGSLIPEGQPNDVVSSTLWARAEIDRLRAEVTELRAARKTEK